MITIEAYEEMVKNTAVYKNHETDLIYPALGLGGECGEYQERVKKLIRDKNSELDENTRRLMLKELSDVAWYLTKNAQVLGSSLQEILQINFTKITDRKIRGKIHGEGDER